jgi:phenylacetic acid degradation operon negative regulatory protein
MAAPVHDARLDRWIADARAAERPRVPSLIVTVWGDSVAPQRDEVWLSTLFALLAPFRANARAVRTGVFRLARGRWLEARAIGRRSRYRLTDAGREGFERAFHRVYDPPFRDWDGRWEALLANADRATAAERRRLRDELHWAGFGRFSADVYLRPARHGDDAARIVEALGLGEAVTAFVARDGPSALASLRDRTDDTFSLGALAHEYRRFLARFAPLARAWPRMRATPLQAFAVRTLLVHAYRRARLRDPQLPREILARDWPGASAYAAARALYHATSPGCEAFVRNTFEASGEPPSPRGRARTRRFEDAASTSAPTWRRHRRRVNRPA